MFHTSACIAAMLMVLACQTKAKGGDFRDSSGYSFTYPDGWYPIAKASQEFPPEKLPPNIRDWLKRNNVSLNQANMILIRDGNGEFRENLNVVVQRGQISADRDSAMSLMAMVNQKYKEMGAEIANPDTSVRKIGTREVIVLDFRAKFPVLPYFLRQKQVFFPGGGNTYVVTMGATDDGFAEHADTFEAILQSFMVPPTTTSEYVRPPSIDWAPALWGGLICGAICALVVGIKRLRRA